MDMGSGNMDHPPVVEFPRRSFWQAIAPFAAFATKCNEDVEAYFDGQWRERAVCG